MQRGVSGLQEVVVAVGRGTGGGGWLDLRFEHISEVTLNGAVR